MKALAALTTLLGGLFVASAAQETASLQELKVLYVCDPTNARTESVTEFLGKHVKQVQSTSRKGFDPKSAQPFDVVLLDWSQSGDTRNEWLKPSPLGERSQWTKPTVLLGSAGLNLAVVWKVRGGSG